MDLAARWRAAVAPFGAGDAVDAAGRAVVERYAEPQRRYHSVAHLVAVVDALFLDLAHDPACVALAAFFHDAVYDPGAPTGANERDSAALAAQVLPALGVPPGRVGEVTRLVMTTIDHRVAADDADGAVLNDADLSVLGAPAAGYAAYVTAVRAEYGWLDEVSWRAGRAQVIAGLLDRPRVFMTARGLARWEVAARANLEGELRALGG